MKTITSVSVALLGVVFSIHTHAACLDSPDTMKELCESGGGSFKASKDAHVCHWGEAKDNHYVRLDCQKCLKGCNADGALSKARFEKLGIQSPSGRAQAQAQQIKLYGQLQRRKIIKTAD